MCRPLDGTERPCAHPKSRSSQLGIPSYGGVRSILRSVFSLTHNVISVDFFANVKKTYRFDKMWPKMPKRHYFLKSWNHQMSVENGNIRRSGNTECGSDHCERVASSRPIRESQSLSLVGKRKHSPSAKTWALSCGLPLLASAWSRPYTGALKFNSLSPRITNSTT